MNHYAIEFRQERYAYLVESPAIIVWSPTRAALEFGCIKRLKTTANTPPLSRYCHNMARRHANGSPLNNLGVREKSSLSPSQWSDVQAAGDVDI